MLSRRPLVGAIASCESAVSNLGCQPQKTVTIGSSLTKNYDCEVCESVVKSQDKGIECEICKG